MTRAAAGLDVSETPVAPERAALESAEAEMRRSGVWIDLDHWHLLAQAHGQLCPRSRASSVRNRAIDVIGKLGDLDLEVEGIKVRDREPAFVVALGLELARRWRTQAGDPETNPGKSEEQRAKLAEKIRTRVNWYRPDGYITLTEAAELVGVCQTNIRYTLRGVRIKEIAAGGYVFLRRADVEKFVASRATAASPDTPTPFAADDHVSPSSDREVGVGGDLSREGQPSC